MSRREKINLQRFAEDPEPMETELEEKEQAEHTEQTTSVSSKPEMRYTEQDLENAVNAAKAEASKLSKMNAQQKQAYELEKTRREKAELESRIAELEKQAMHETLSKQAAEIMKKDHDIIATPDMLDFVVGEDAEQTNQRIAKLVGIMQDDRKMVEQARATGTTPRSFRNSGGALSEIEKRIAKYR